jgi:hypothetical protein
MQIQQQQQRQLHPAQALEEANPWKWMQMCMMKVTRLLIRGQYSFFHFYHS